jgi:hypothetical protein
VSIIENGDPDELMPVTSSAVLPDSARQKKGDLNLGREVVNLLFKRNQACARWGKRSRCSHSSTAPRDASYMIHVVS